MMPSRRPWSRETRLLLLTIAVSAAVLLVLARFRFPNQPPAPPAQPLEQLATRATFEELAGILERLDRTIAPSVMVLRVASPDTLMPRTLTEILDGAEATVETASYVPALRVRPDAAIALLGPEQTVQSLVGDDRAVPLVIARDPIRRMSLIRVPPPPAEAVWQWRPLNAVTVPRYVVSLEASRGGPVLRPIFFPRADRFAASRWEQPLLTFGYASTVPEGAFVFSLQGELVGLAVRENGLMALVPAASVQASAERLFERGTPQPVDFGLALRSLGPLDAKALGVSSGLMIAAVAPESIASGHLRAGDLIQSVDGMPASDVDTLLLRLAETPPGTTVTFTVRRDDETIDVPVTTPPAGEPVTP